MRGVDILVEVESEEEGQFVTVGGQRGATLNETVETVDVTSKDSGGAYEYDYGFFGWTISADGLYVKNDEGYELLKQAMRQKKKVKVQIKEEGTATETGEALVISRDLEGPYDGEVTYTIELQGTGNLETAK